MSAVLCARFGAGHTTYFRKYRVAWSLDGILTYRLMLKVKVAEMVAEGQLERLVSVIEASHTVHIYHEVDVRER